MTIKSFLKNIKLNLDITRELSNEGFKLKTLMLGKHSPSLKISKAWATEKIKWKKHKIRLHVLKNIYNWLIGLKSLKKEEKQGENK